MELLEVFEIRKAVKCNKNFTNEQTEFFIPPLLKSLI